MDHPWMCNWGLNTFSLHTFSLLLLTQRESRQEERECMCVCVCVCCEMPEVSTHNINTDESLCLNIAFHWLKQIGYISMDCTHFITVNVLKPV